MSSTKTALSLSDAAAKIEHFSHQLIMMQCSFLMRHDCAKRELSIVSLSDADKVKHIISQSDITLDAHQRRIATITIPYEIR